MLMSSNEADDQAVGHASRTPLHLALGFTSGLPYLQAFQCLSRFECPIWIALAGGSPTYQPTAYSTRAR